MTKIEEEGKQELERRREHDRQRRENWNAQCTQRDNNDYRFYFYRKHYIRGRDGYVEDPENPFPPIEKIDYVYVVPSPTGCCRLVCEGISYFCEYEYKGTGGDPAYWDDGWWPRFFVLKKRKFFVGYAKIPVGSPEDV